MPSNNDQLNGWMEVWADNVLVLNQAWVMCKFSWGCGETSLYLTSANWLSMPEVNVLSKTLAGWHGTVGNGISVVEPHRCSIFVLHHMFCMCYQTGWMFSLTPFFLTPALSTDGPLSIKLVWIILYQMSPAEIWVHLLQFLCQIHRSNEYVM